LRTKRKEKKLVSGKRERTGTALADREKGFRRARKNPHPVGLKKERHGQRLPDVMPKERGKNRGIPL